MEEFSGWLVPAGTRHARGAEPANQPRNLLNRTLLLLIIFGGLIAVVKECLGILHILGRFRFFGNLTIVIVGTIDQCRRSGGGYCCGGADCDRFHGKGLGPHQVWQDGQEKPNRSENSSMPTQIGVDTTGM